MKIIRPEQQQSRKPPSRSQAAKAIAREKAVENVRRAYIDLTCGHLTTYENSEFWPDGATSEYPHYCEVCHAYRKQKERILPVYPDEPPF